MREIKFRVWDDKLKKMFIFDDWFINNMDNCGLTFMGDYDGDDRNNTHLMQFTGLHDKNGKEIYEGDIVETETATGEHKFAVEYDTDSASYMCPAIVDDECVTTLGQLPNSIEIIGNIYENPELLTNHK